MLEIQVSHESVCVREPMCRPRAVYFTETKYKKSLEKIWLPRTMGFRWRSQRASWVWADLRSGGWLWCWTAERTFAHRRSTEKKSVRLSSPTVSSLIHLKADTGEELSPCSFKLDNSTPSPAHADEPVYRNARRVVPKPLLCVADWRELGGAVCRQMIRVRCSPHSHSAILCLSRCSSGFNTIIPIDFLREKATYTVTYTPVTVLKNISVARW